MEKFSHSTALWAKKEKKCKNPGLTYFKYTEEKEDRQLTECLLWKSVQGQPISALSPLSLLSSSAESELPERTEYWENANKNKETEVKTEKLSILVKKKL